MERKPANEQPNKTDISKEIQTTLGAQIMQIIQVTKQRDELQIMLNAMEEESKELKAKVK